MTTETAKSRKPQPVLLDCRAGWSTNEHIVAGWRKTTLHFVDCYDPVTMLPDEKMSKSAAEKHPASQMCILDIEHWPLPADIPKYIQVVDWWREVRPELRIGYYGILPKIGYWPAFHGGTRELDWKQENAALGRSRAANGSVAERGLVDVVDFVCPCLYTFYAKHDGGYWWDHEATWLNQFAPKMIEAARQYQKQIYPFVWMRIQREDGDFSHTVPADHFRQQIRFCLENADGCAIWDWDQEKNAKLVMTQTDEIMKEFV